MVRAGGRKEHTGQGCEVPAFAGTTSDFAQTTHAINVRVGAAVAQWASVIEPPVGVNEHGALHWDGHTGYRRINPLEGLTLEDHQG